MAGVLAGRVALVTGASSGIGEGIAVALAGAGATVVVVARRADRLNALVEKIAKAGGTAVAMAGDVTQEAVATGVVADAVKRFGRLDILVNSAGIVQVGTVENADLAEWRRVMDINFAATLYTCHAAIAPMKAQGGGDIINVSSMAGLKNSAIFNPYSTSKHALNSMSDAMRQEVGNYGIRVCIVMPGATTTEVAETISDPKTRDAMRHHVSKDGAMMPEDVAAAVLLVVSLPRRANISEIQIRPTIDTTPSN